MNKSIRFPLAIASLAFASLTMADDLYFGLADGNPDLSSGPATSERRTEQRIGVQPGIGDRADIYHGLGRGNPDLFSAVRDGKEHGPRPDIYGGFGDHHDLSY
jgi:hypothetical protein